MRILPLTRAGTAAAVASARPSESAARDVTRVVAEILETVRTRGDQGLVETSARLDHPGATVAGLRVPAGESEEALARLDPDLRAALEVARDNCTWFHRRELREGWEAAGPQGQRLGIRYLPVDRAGLYVPGGLGAYASTVIMNAVPALVAGVGSLFICTPPGRDGAVNESVLAAARLVGVDEVYRVGGAQSVAAMAYGTETIARADVICGPGNAYVTEAKRQVFGTVGIDGLAGPSEVVIVADGHADPRLVAADMLAQAEHGSGATAVLIAASEALCREVEAQVRALRAAAETSAAPVRGAPRAAEGVPAAGADAVAEGGPAPQGSGDRAWAEAGAPWGESALLAFYPARAEPFAETALAFVNAYAPEHLEVHSVDPRGFLAGVTAAGAVFLGAHTPTAFGDYVAGSNHVLPTGGAARYSSPLSVDTFIRRSTVVEVPPDAAAELTPYLGRIARSEGFEFHRVSAELRGVRGRFGPAR